MAAQTLGIVCLLLLALQGALSQQLGTGSDEFVEVSTKNGIVRGQKSAVRRKFLGIPYAQPPVGDLRWREPIAALPWTGVRDALVFGHDCPQKVNLFIKNHSEDCLYLNVYSPANITNNTSNPVMVFIHGGAYEQGGSSVPLYTGEYVVPMANVILVTFNYRLGSLGSAASPALGEGDRLVVDPQLTRSKANIAAFGGDPSRVLIFGESAGAGSVAAHLLTPLSKGLFSAAILESGAFSIWASVRNISAETTFDKFARVSSCSSSPDIVQCLLALSVDRILEAQSAMMVTSASLNWAPTVDGVELLDWPETMAANGQFASKVPVIMGTNSAEAAALVTQIFGKTLNQTAFDEIVDLLFGAAAGLVKFAYPTTDYSSPWWALESILTDSLFVCPARRSVRWLSKAGVSSYLYSFAHTPSLTVIPGCTSPCHASELPYVFHVQPLLDTDVERSLSAAIVGYWSALAARGTPTSPRQPTWVEFTRWNDRVLVLNDTISVMSGLRVKQCNFWDFVQKLIPTGNLTSVFDALMNKMP